MDIECKVKMVVRYTKLTVELSEYYLKNSEWKPEYKHEIEAIRAELLQLRAGLGLDDPIRISNNQGKR